MITLTGFNNHLRCLVDWLVIDSEQSNHQLDSSRHLTEFTSGGSSNSSIENHQHSGSGCPAQLRALRVTDPSMEVAELSSVIDADGR